MEEEKKGFIGIQNWVGKLLLMIIGAVWLVSDLYDNIMANFFLTERSVESWGGLGDWGVLGASSGLILGGVYLNRLLDLINLKK